MNYRVNQFEVFDDVAQWPEGLRTLHAHWDHIRAGRALPLRADFDPLDVPQHLPDIALVDIGPEGDEFTYRVVGTRVADAIGYDRTGQTASTAYADNPALGDTLGGLVRRLVEARRPFAIRAALYWVGRDHVTLDASILPLADSEGRVCAALVECLFGPTDPGPPLDAA